MKKIILIALVLFVVNLKSAKCQKISEVSFELKFVDSLVKLSNFRESGIEVWLKNEGNEDIYIPNILSFFGLQVSDSLFILRTVNGENFKISNVMTGRSKDNHNPPPGLHFVGSTYFKYNQYATKFQRKKQFGENLIQNEQEFKEKVNFNLLFLKKGETFTLYHIDPSIFLYTNPGCYKLFLNFHKKADADLPEEISGFKKYSIPSIQTKPLFINVEDRKRVFDITVKDGEGKRLKKFKWPKRKK